MFLKTGNKIFTIGVFVNKIPIIISADFFSYWLVAFKSRTWALSSTRTKNLTTFWADPNSNPIINKGKYLSNLDIVIALVVPVQVIGLQN